MGYVDFEMQNARITVANYLDDVLRLGYNNEFSDISFSKAKKNYETILKRLYELKLPDPKMFVFEKITLEELITQLENILVKIVGYDKLPFIQSLEGKIKKEPNLYYFDSVIEEDIKSMPPTIRNIYISKKLYTIQIASTGHEFIHALMSKYKGNLFNEHFTNIHYNELLSILVEYIIIYELSELLKDNDLVKKHEVIRISHDHDQAKELLDMRKLSGDIRKSKLPDAQFFRQYSEYQEHNALTYIVDDIYSISLLRYFKEDEKTLIKIIRAILDGEKTLLDLIKYYDLSLRNYNVIGLYNEQIDRTLTFKK